MDDWEKSNETTKQQKLEQLKTRRYYRWKLHISKKSLQRFCLGEYHDLYLKSDILLLANVLESFKKICLEIYELDPVKFISAPGIAWHAALKKF